MASPKSGETESRAEEKLTPERAREALLVVESGSHGGIGWEVLQDATKRGAIKLLDDHTCEIGPWHCDLAKKTFVGTVDFPKAPRHNHNEWSGVFERTAEGRWRAKVTRSVSADAPEPKG